MSSQSFLFNREPHWQGNQRFLQAALPARLHRWLYETGSLTQRLRETYGQGVAVKVLQHHWSVPFVSERQLLNQAPKQRCLVREVLLYVDVTPLILARTIIPASTVQQTQGSLLRLGTRPIGEVIFAYRQLDSCLCDVTRLGVPQWRQPVVELVGIETALHGRRTRHKIAGNTLLISEFFLPALF